MIRIDRKQKVTDNNCDFKFLMKQNLIMILTRYVIFRLGTLYAKMTELQLDCALDLMRRLPPQQIEKNLSDLIDLVRLEILINFLFQLVHVSGPRLMRRLALKC